MGLNVITETVKDVKDILGKKVKKNKEVIKKKVKEVIETEVEQNIKNKIHKENIDNLQKVIDTAKDIKENCECTGRLDEFTKIRLISNWGDAKSGDILNVLTSDLPKISKKRYKLV